MRLIGIEFAAADFTQALRTGAGNWQITFLLRLPWRLRRALLSR